MKRLLWCGDAGCSSGFARATHETLRSMDYRETPGGHFDVSVLGLNHYGDPTSWPYPIYPCYPGGDAFGLGRVKELVNKIAPSVIVVQNDPWNFQEYLKRCGNVPVVGAVAVDGLNCKGKQLNGLAHAIFWTKFGETQAKLGGYTGPSTVIPLGVDLDIYKPLDRVDVRDRMGLFKVFEDRGLPKDAFIVGVVGRNQPRKRLDLTIEYFAEWIHSHNIEDALLWLHVAPTGEQAYDLEQLCDYYKISNRVVIPKIEMIHGLKEDAMARCYNVFDVLFTTTQGEGFGLPMFEAMACGTPVIAPDWSALGELLKDVAYLIDCPATAATINGINTIGGIPDKEQSVLALDEMYQSEKFRAEFSRLGLTTVQQDRYRWSNIGKAFNIAVEEALYQPSMVTR